LQKAVNFLVSQIVNSGIRHVVICPGSRSAPLTLAFVRHPQLTCYSLVDERSAAFTALGMAIGSRNAVAIVCTSGTAVLNLYPAICEAFYSQIPLLVITADRPAELIDQWDGQCIRQDHIFEKHSLGSFTFDPFKPHDNIAEEIQLCMYPKMGPVHINVPLAEPLYEAKNTEFEYPASQWVSDAEIPEVQQLPELPSYNKIMLLAGADAIGDRFSETINTLVNAGKVVVLNDIISGLHSTQTVYHWDALATLSTDKQKDELRPDLLITMGKFTVSKGLKRLLREYKPKQHWHVTPNHTIADPFVTDPQEIKCSEAVFLNWLISSTNQFNDDYVQQWKNAENKISDTLNQLLSSGNFNEFTVVYKLLQNLEKGTVLHSANSMPVRYLSFLAGEAKHLQLYANRGTSGIDGSTSTAVGHSMQVDKQVILLTGDLSFFYDINGLWNKYIGPNFKIVVLNNGGGGIFRLIDGPSDLPEREEFFATSNNLKNPRNCKALAKEFGFDYYQATDMPTFLKNLSIITNDKKSPGILEVFIAPEQTIEFYKAFKKLEL
jgi:2-succinyl-5-enolpyruvyl-6-hydroxy-3-cyclohexene-1-carboxylate synthase